MNEDQLWGRQRIARALKDGISEEGMRALEALLELNGATAFNFSSPGGNPIPRDGMTFALMGAHRDGQRAFFERVKAFRRYDISLTNQ